MFLSDFDFVLPEALIAQHPPEVRGSSRLLVALDGQPRLDQLFTAFPDYLQAGDVLVFNNTKVIKARLFGQKASGGKIEALVERVLNEREVLAHVRASKSPKVGTELIFEGDVRAVMLGREGELFHLRFDVSTETSWDILERVGHLPLPPYIERSADDDDDERYQTVYAAHQGAVAAPTAGLHFTDAVLEALQAKGVVLQYVTLHVGAGTFQPVREENLDHHKMHSEWFNIPADTVAAINAAKASGNKVWAVGTTSMRSLEAGSVGGSLVAGSQETDIFITPGYRFNTVDGLLTNFHLPKSTLLMLVSAFAGYAEMQAIYQHAIKQEYRFFSYGDAMLLSLKPH